MNKLIIAGIIFVSLIVLGLGGYSWYSVRQNQARVASQVIQPKPEPQPQKVLTANLSSPNQSSASGQVKVIYSSTYSLVATFANLPDPQPGYFYEGWLVSNSPPKAITTGKITKLENVFTNIFGSADDHTSYTQYVLTLEPDDGNPQPGEHVLEGFFTPSP